MKSETVSDRQHSPCDGCLGGFPDSWIPGLVTEGSRGSDWLLRRLLNVFVGGSSV